jgi:acetoin utilization protein AcuB
MDFERSLREVMTARVITVQLDDRLGIVQGLFASGKIHHLLAVETDGELIGVVSDLDLYKALSPNLGTANENFKDTATLNKCVHQVMSRHPLVLKEDDTIGKAVALFNSHVISCIPIVNDANHPVGIVTWRDILRQLAPPVAPS